MQRIEFRTGDTFLLADAAPITPETTTTSIAADLYLPTFGSGPFPAVVLSQGLSGVSRSREHRYAKLLADHGIAALVFDSFAARSRSKLADPFKALHVSETMMLGDAFAALAYLANRHDIRADNIAIVGFSYGGMIAVLAAYRQIAETFLPKGPRFSRHVAYYGCSIPRLDDPTTTGAPVTMLIGEKDRNVDLPRTREIAEDLRSGGSKVDLTLYPDLFHQWDDADAGHKFVLLELAGCRMRVMRDNQIVDQRTGMRMRGWWSRSAILAISTSPMGYHTKPDAAATAVSDAHLISALAWAEKGSARPPKNRAPASLREIGVMPSAELTSNARVLAGPVAER